MKIGNFALKVKTWGEEELKGELLGGREVRARVQRPSIRSPIDGSLLPPFEIDFNILRKNKKITTHALMVLMAAHGSN
jgi:hypothetical protein